MSSSRNECQIYGNSSHLASACPVLYIKCRSCNNCMVLITSNRDTCNSALSCSNRRCLQLTTVIDALEMLKPTVPPPSAPRQDAVNHCYHCGHITYESIHCPWKNQKCKVKGCPGMLWIRVVPLQCQNFGKKYLECECCYDRTWLDEYIHSKFEREQKLSKSIKDMCVNAMKRTPRSE